MSWHFNSITETIGPILKIWKYIGLPIYELDQTNQKFISKNSYFCFVLLVFLFSLFITFIYLFQTYENFYAFVVYFQLSTVYLQTFTALIFYRIKQSCLKILLNEFKSVELHVFRFCQKSKYCVTLSTKVLIPIIFYAAMLLWIMIADLLFSRNNFKILIYLLIFHVGNVVNLCYFMFLHCILVTFNTLFQMFLYQLDTKRYDIKHAIQVQFFLHDLSINLHKTFQMFLMFKFLSDFVLIAGQVFFERYAISKNVVLYYDIFQTIMVILIILSLDFIIVNNFCLFYEQVG